MHFFSPANVMKLCEIVRAAKTAPDALTTAVAVARKIAKVPAVVGVCDGFVGNRMLAQRGKQAEKLLFEGALPQQVDAVVTKFGMPMGPFAMGDLAGLDIGWRSRKDRGIKSEIADALCEAGRFGQKTGKGYYKYEAGSRAALPDPEVEKLIDETLQRLGAQAARGQRRRNPRAHDVSDDQRRRADPRREDRGASERHRRDLALRLWLADLSRRPDVLRRPGRPASTSPTGCRSTPRKPTIPRSNRRRCSSASPPKARPLRRWRRRRKRRDGDSDTDRASFPSPLRGGSGMRGSCGAAPPCGPPLPTLPEGGGSAHLRSPRIDACTHDPSRRTILSGRRPLGRSDRARHAARPAVEGGDRITARGRRSNSATVRSAMPSWKRMVEVAAVGVPARRLRQEHFGGAVPRQFARSSRQFLRRAEGRRPHRASVAARRRDARCRTN